MSARLTETIGWRDSVPVNCIAFHPEHFAQRLNHSSNAPLNQIHFLCYETLYWYTQLKNLGDLVISSPLTAKYKE